MCLHTICRFFKINALINFVFLLLIAALFYAMSDQIYQFHSHMFAITRERFDEMFYGFIGLYKLFFWIFNLVPAIALCCLCRCPKTKDRSCCDQKAGCNKPQDQPSCRG